MKNESRVMLGLMARGLPPHVAQGVTANLIAESRLDPGINEISPLVPGSRGGYGLAQWTGPRRVALEQAAQERGVPVNDMDFQLDYLMTELHGPERRSMNALQGAGTAEDAARIFSEQFLRPGIPHMDTRLAHARRLAGQPAQDVSQAYAAQYEPPPQGNALAAPPQGLQQPAGPQLAFAAQDPSAFQMQLNALAQPVAFQPRYLNRRA